MTPRTSPCPHGPLVTDSTNDEGGALIQTRELRPGRIAIAVAVLLSLAAIGVVPAHAWPPAAHPKSHLECEQKFEKGASWHKCFSEPPGSSCAHPLEIRKSGRTELGDHKYFKVSFSEEQNNPLQVYKWTTLAGVAICPHGVVYRLEKIYANGYNRIIPVHSGPHGGSFEYELPNEPPEEFTLVVRGYFVHPGSRPGVNQNGSRG